MQRSHLFLSASLLTWACASPGDAELSSGSETQGNSDAEAIPLNEVPLGIYEVEDYLANAENCGEPTEDHAMTPAYPVSTYRDDGQFEFVVFWSCSTLTECEGIRQAGVPVGPEVGWAYITHAFDDGTMVGVGSDTQGMDLEGNCTLLDEEQALTLTSDGGLEIDERSLQFIWPVGPEGTCDTPPEGTDSTCTGRRVLNAMEVG